MERRGFRAQVRPDAASGIAIIDLSGELNADAEEKLNATYAQVIQHDSRQVLLNFADVSYINSTGIALVVGVLARARKEHRDITACGLTEHYREIFEITRLSDFMPIFSDEASALANQATTTTAT